LSATHSWSRSDYSPLNVCWSRSDCSQLIMWRATTAWSAVGYRRWVPGTKSNSVKYKSVMSFCYILPSTHTIHWTSYQRQFPLLLTDSKQVKLLFSFYRIN